MNTPCKDCPDRHPVCHDSCLKYAEFKRQRGAEAAYTREMLDTGKVTTTTTRTATGSGAARSTWERTEERTDESCAFEHPA